MFSFRKLLGCVLAPVGAFTIIGSGFSLWYFVDGDNPVATKPIDIGVNALDAVSQGNIDIIQSPHLVVLSQGSSNSENLFDGMVFYSIEMIEMYLLCSREILNAFQRQLAGEIKSTNWEILLH